LKYGFHFLTTDGFAQVCLDLKTEYNAQTVDLTAHDYCVKEKNITFFAWLCNISYSKYLVTKKSGSHSASHLHIVKRNKKWWSLTHSCCNSNYSFLLCIYSFNIAIVHVK